MEKENLPQEKNKRKYVNQSQIPTFSFEETLKVAKSIVDDFGAKGAAPFQVAMAIESSQTSSYWRKLSGSSVAYGLTTGGYNSTKIEITDLAKKILMPTEEGIEKIAIKEAVLKPDLIQKFFDKYNNAKFPKDSIAENVLKIDFNIEARDTARVLEIIKLNGLYAGIIHETKTGLFVNAESDLHNDSKSDRFVEIEEIKAKDEGLEEEIMPEELAKKLNLKKETSTTEAFKNGKPKVFISHGKNKVIVEQLKEILTFGQFDVIVSVEKESTAISVPDKVFLDMRNSDAAVIHIEGEKELLDKEGNVHHSINENVLIEIGAAIALYGKKFILLCEKSVSLPSNLQGLYRCNYEGKELSYEATMKLLKAFNEFRVS